MQAGIHVIFWFMTVLLFIMVCVFVIAVCQDLLYGTNPLSKNLPNLLGFGALFVVVYLFWRKYWFLAGDLRMLVLDHGGTAFRKQAGLTGNRVKARIGDLWLLGTLNRPIMDFLPTYDFDRNKPKDIPEYMVEGARVNLFRLGDFGSLPQVELQVKMEQPSNSPPTDTGHSLLDNALRNAARVLTNPNIVLTVEIREDWLRVEVNRGVWLGSQFVQHISQALAFADRLTEGLSSYFTPADPEEWTVEQVYTLRGVWSGFRVGPIHTKKQSRMDLFLLPIMLDKANTIVRCYSIRESIALVFIRRYAI